MLVNGHCKVLKEHCLKSDFASFYYMNNRGFNQALRRIEQSEDLREEMGEKGVFYDYGALKASYQEYLNLYIFSITCFSLFIIMFQS